MLTRLHIQGFRNLQDVEVRFGPLTCLVGENGAGKTNLLDAIRLLTLLSRYPIQEAVERLTSLDPHHGTTENLFTRFHDYMAPELRLEADMLLHRDAEDELGLRAEASTSSVRYIVTLRLAADGAGPGSSPRLELAHESLEPITLRQTRRELGFPCSGAFKDSVVTGRRVGPFISTSKDAKDPQIHIHQEGHGTKTIPARRTHWTALGGTAAGEFPTLLATTCEMRSWRFFHLEPSALARPSHREDRLQLEATGGRLSAALERIRRGRFGGGSDENKTTDKSGNRNDDGDRNENSDGGGGGNAALRRLSDRLSGFVGRKVHLRVQLDPESETVRPAIEGDDATPHPLSGGMRRYLALATLLENPEGNALLSIEEPENGIHPSGLRELVHLIQDLAVDPHTPTGPNNPLRQVLLSTHSPMVLQCLDDEEMVYLKRIHYKGTYFQGEVAQVHVPEESWRNEAQPGSKPLRDEHVRPYFSAPKRRAEQTSFLFDATKKNEDQSSEASEIQEPDEFPKPRPEASRQPENASDSVETE